MFASPFISYAQNGEDVLLWRALKHVQHGFYIDVGAQDPVVESVTKAFYERGWHGINLEPVPHWHERLVAQRPRDINLRLAASDRPGTLTLFDVEGTGLSTASADFAHRHEHEGRTLHELSVECATLDQVCTDHHIETVHFLKIDCEGAEKQVLEGIALTDVRPWIILLEATEPNSDVPTWQQWEHLLTGRGYRFVFFDGLNRYYLADAHADLAPAFAAPVNVFDSARRAPDLETERQRDRLQTELAELAATRDQLRTRHEESTRALATLSGEHDQLRIRHEESMRALESLAAERESLRAQHVSIQREVRAYRGENQQLRDENAELRSSRSWRITAPLRAGSVAARWISRRVRYGAYLALRPFAHLARPVLRGAAKSGQVRTLVLLVLGERSRIVSHMRLFLNRGAHADDASAGTGKRLSGLRSGSPESGVDLRPIVNNGPGVEVEVDALDPDAPFDPEAVMARVRVELDRRRQL